MRFANDSEVRCELVHIRAYDYLPYHLRSKGYEIGRRPINNQMRMSSMYSVTSLVGLFSWFSESFDSASDVLYILRLHYKLLILKDYFQYSVFNVQ